MQAKIWNHNQLISETDTEVLRNQFDAMLRACGFSILHYIEHRFEPQGFTALWLLEESHFAIHSFPEEGVSYIELSSCSLKKQAAFLKAIEHMYFK